MKLMRKILGNKKGATAIEYGLIAAGIAVAIATVVGTIGGSLKTKFESINTSLGGTNS